MGLAALFSKADNPQRNLAASVYTEFRIRIPSANPNLPITPTFANRTINLHQLPPNRLLR